MRYLLVLLASLLPFLHETVYEAEVKGCDASGITLSAEGETFAAELFNVGYMEEGGWQDTCALLADATQVRFEIDPAVQVEEPLPVYLYADGVMVQVSLLEDHKAYIEIKSPSYLYEDTLEMAEGTRAVMADAHEPIERGSAPLRSYLAYAFVLGVWLFLFYHLIVRHRNSAHFTQKRISGRKPSQQQKD